MKNTLFVVMLVYVLLPTYTYAYVGTPNRQIQKYGKTDICQIGNIDDGDTFDLDCLDGYYPDVRLLGVNAPDFNHHIESGNCYYNQAQDYINEKREKTYNVTFYGNDLCKDPFKGCRNLVQLVETKSKIDLGQMMILRGIAFEWTNFSNIPDELKKTYKTMEKISMNNNLGLWGQCHIVSSDTVSLDSSIPNKMTTVLKIK